MAIPVLCNNSAHRTEGTLSWTTDKEGTRELQLPEGWRLVEVRFEGAVEPRREEHQFLACGEACALTVLAQFYEERGGRRR